MEHSHIPSTDPRQSNSLHLQKTHIHRHHHSIHLKPSPSTQICFYQEYLFIGVYVAEMLIVVFSTILEVHCKGRTNRIWRKCFLAFVFVLSQSHCIKHEVPMWMLTRIFYVPRNIQLHLISDVSVCAWCSIVPDCNLCVTQCDHIALSAVFNVIWVIITVNHVHTHHLQLTLSMRWIFGDKWVIFLYFGKK
jgi:hypothetical protein